MKKIKKGILSTTGSGIMKQTIILTNNEIKHIIKVNKSLENRDILLKGSTRNIISQEGGFLNFPRPLITAGLLLTKIVLAPLAKTVFLSFKLSPAMSLTEAAIQKSNSWIKNYSFINFKWRNGRYNENS